jgi:hypothetical protein
MFGALANENDGFQNFVSAHKLLRRTDTTGSERVTNGYSLTSTSGGGAKAENPIQSMMIRVGGAVERTRTSTGCPASTSS